MFRITQPIIAMMAAVMIAASPAAADDVEEALQAALDAYRAGDLALATEETAFAAQLLAQKKAAGLSAFLPEPLSGWTAEDPDTESATAMATMFGGGQVATRVYDGPVGDIEIRLMADNPMVAQMGAMFSNPAIMAAAGTVKRIAGQRAMMDDSGDLMALIGGRFLIQISGGAPETDKEAYFEAIDFEGLKAF
ncbi:MAG: hypothetical protein AAF577_06715 [Pseudomonadota bacterium]